jgi:hypothetical protein
MAQLFARLLALGGKSSGYLGRKRRRRRMAKLEQSGLFDRAWYLETYPDVRDSGVDPLRHYLESGWKEGRDPGPDFCTTAYLKTNSDVAAIGVNPLLHYVEHGRAEGRGTPHQTGPLRAVLDPVVKFGPAAPCVQFPLAGFQVTSWARAGRIDDRNADAVELAGVRIAKVNDPSQRLMLEQALNRLAWLSGEAGAPWLDGSARAGTALDIRDAWYAGQGIFRTRWQVEQIEPVVIRAFQQTGIEPELVGEACIGSDLELLDMRLGNPLFPILFLFAKPDGELLGIRHLTFPGLCRGNLHYPELLAHAQSTPASSRVDIASIDEQLAARIIELRATNVASLIAELIVDLEDADGTRPLFQSYVQTWLARVMNVPARPLVHTGDARLEYMASAIAETPAFRRTGTARLQLSSDMIPTITVLSASCKPGTITDELAGSLIVASEDTALASTLVNVPMGMPAAEIGGAKTALATLAPCDPAIGLSAQVPLLAIRLERRRPLSEVELLFPAASKEIAAPQSISISWLIWPEDWTESDLAQTLEALLQQRSCASSVCFVGEPSAGAREIAGRLFEGRVAVAPDPLAAAATIKTRLCGYLGPSVILHDRHTVERLAPVLDLPDALTATALTVSAEKRGKGTVVCPADSGHVSDARLLPGAIVPIAGTPRDFWISRAVLATTWLRAAADALPTGRHLCSTLVAVSKLAPGAATELPFTLPPTPNNRTISTELVIG